MQEPHSLFYIIQTVDWMGMHEPLKSIALAEGKTCVNVCQNMIHDSSCKRSSAPIRRWVYRFVGVGRGKYQKPAQTS